MWRRELPFVVVLLTLFLVGAALVWIPNAGATGETEFVPLPIPATSTNWDGDAKNGASGIIDLSAEFGMPEGIKAVACRMTIVDETVGVGASLGPSSTYAGAIIASTVITNTSARASGISPCDENGDIYFFQSDELDVVTIQCFGYFTPTLATVTPIPTDTPGWYIPTLTPIPTETPISTVDPDPFDTVITQTLSTGDQWAFVREIDTGEIIIGGLTLTILAVFIFRKVIRP